MRRLLTQCPRFLLPAALLGLCLPPALASTVQFQTVLGNFEVALFDEATPITVTDFLALVAEGRYENSIIHRSESGFIVQGGGYFLENDTLNPIPFTQAREHEVMFSNVRGTIALASAAAADAAQTAQWFINLADNGATLDLQNGGFSVFGSVIDNGMAVVDAIAGLESLNFETFPALPLRNYGAQDALNGVEIARDNYVIVHNIVLLDEGDNDSPATVGLPPRVAQPTPTPTADSDGDADKLEGIGSVGAPGFLTLLLALFVPAVMRAKRGA